MLRPDDFVDLVKFARAAGERQFGPYEGHANRLTGPPRRSSVTGRGAGRGQSSPPSSSSPFDKVEDPITGEVLYKAKR